MSAAKLVIFSDSEKMSVVKLLDNPNSAYGYEAAICEF